MNMLSKTPEKINESIHKVQAACRLGWGIASGMEWINCAGPSVSCFALSVPLHCSSIWICTGAVSTEIGCEAARNSLFVLQSHQSTARAQCEVRSVYQQSVLTWCNITWQQGKWGKLHWCICDSFTWNAFTASYMPCPWTDRFPCWAQKLYWELFPTQPTDLCMIWNVGKLWIYFPHKRLKLTVI